MSVLFFYSNLRARYHDRDFFGWTIAICIRGGKRDRNNETVHCTEKRPKFANTFHPLTAAE